jgi:hypothetical protein
MFRSSQGHHQAVLCNTIKVNWTADMDPYFGAMRPYYVCYVNSYALRYNVRITVLSLSKILETIQGIYI